MPFSPLAFTGDLSLHYFEPPTPRPSASSSSSSSSPFKLTLSPLKRRRTTTQSHQDGPAVGSHAEEDHGDAADASLSMICDTTLGALGRAAEGLPSPVKPRSTPRAKAKGAKPARSPFKSVSTNDLDDRTSMDKGKGKAQAREQIWSCTDAEELERLALEEEQRAVDEERRKRREGIGRIQAEEREVRERSVGETHISVPKSKKRSPRKTGAHLEDLAPSSKQDLTPRPPSGSSRSEGEASSTLSTAGLTKVEAKAKGIREASKAMKTRAPKAPLAKVTSAEAKPPTASAPANDVMVKTASARAAPPKPTATKAKPVQGAPKVLAATKPLSASSAMKRKTLEQPAAQKRPKAEPTVAAAPSPDKPVPQSKPLVKPSKAVRPAPSAAARSKTAVPASSTKPRPKAGPLNSSKTTEVDQGRPPPMGPPKRLIKPSNPAIAKPASPALPLDADAGMTEEQASGAEAAQEDLMLPLEKAEVDLDSARTSTQGSYLPTGDASTSAHGLAGLTPLSRSQSNDVEEGPEEAKHSMAADAASDSGGEAGSHTEAEMVHGEAHGQANWQVPAFDAEDEPVLHPAEGDELADELHADGQPSIEEAVERFAVPGHGSHERALHPLASRRSSHLTAQFDTKREFEAEAPIYDTYETGSEGQCDAESIELLPHDLPILSIAGVPRLYPGLVPGFGAAGGGMGRSTTLTLPQAPKLTNRPVKPRRSAAGFKERKEALAREAARKAALVKSSTGKRTEARQEPRAEAEAGAKTGPSATTKAEIKDGRIVKANPIPAWLTARKEQLKAEQAQRLGEGPQGGRREDVRRGSMAGTKAPTAPRTVR